MAKRKSMAIRPMGLSPPPCLLHERDQGEEGLQRDLSLQHVADDELQASESLIWQIRPKMKRPEVATHASFPLAASEDIPHMSDRHRLQLVLWHGTLLLQELKSFGQVLSVAFSVDLPFGNSPSGDPGSHPCRNGGTKLLPHLCVFRLV